MQRNGNSVTLELIKKFKDKNRKKQIEKKINKEKEQN